jgi:hypothetical protein
MWLGISKRVSLIEIEYSQPHKDVIPDKVIGAPIKILPPAFMKQQGSLLCSKSPPLGPI